MTKEQEDTLRANTTAGDDFTVHSASAACWKTVWEMLEVARAAKDLAIVQRNKAQEALRHMALCGDTLSPQEMLDNAATGLGAEPWKYGGECDPNKSIVTLAGEIALEQRSKRKMRSAMAMLLASAQVFVDSNTTMTGEERIALVEALDAGWKTMAEVR